MFHSPCGRRRVGRSTKNSRSTPHRRIAGRFWDSKRGRSVLPNVKKVNDLCATSDGDLRRGRCARKLMPAMHMSRARTLAAWTLLAFACAPAPLPAFQVPPPPPPAAPADDPTRVALENRLKELQRREQFDTMDLRTREDLIKRIIDDCIELGRDFT